MAPVLGATRAEVVEKLRGKQPDEGLPITLAPHGAPKAIVDRDGDAWVVRALELDHARTKAAYEEAMAGGGTWWPEMQWRFLEPGEVLLSAESATALADAIEAWDRDLFRPD